MKQSAQFLNPESGIPAAEIVSALSFALDLTEDAVPGHALRTCLLGMRLAEALGLEDRERSSLFYALLLKDIGCSSNAARLYQIMGSDERQVKREIRLEDWTRPSLSGARMFWRNLLPGRTRFQRFTRLLEIGVHQKQYNREMFTLRCDRGADIVLRTGLPVACSEAVRHLDEHWDGSGFPGMLRQEQIPLLSRILLIAQQLDGFATSRGKEAAVGNLRERSGRWYDPSLVRTAEALHREGSLWPEMQDRDSRAAVLDMEPGERLVAPPAQIDDICGAFADVIDVKSSFTGSHSRSVTRAALQMAEVLGFSAERRLFISRAALLHDLGKLCVPNSILDKPGRLTRAEIGVVQEHPALTRTILSRVRHFRDLAVVAGQHHEKLDGSGYPEQLRADALSPEARLIAVADVYSALAEDRPYRAGLSLAEIRCIMDRESGTRLDATAYEALLAAVSPAAAPPVPSGVVRQSA